MCVEPKVPCYEDKCGECPEPTHCTWNEHSRHCHRDCDCPGKQKCCVTKNNKRICVEPKAGSCHEKPGECPDPAHCIWDHWNCKTCRCDDECPGNQKCCCTKDGKRMCVEPKGHHHHHHPPPHHPHYPPHYPVPCYEDKCGECPEPTHCTWNEHSRHCHRDCDCPGKQKCCVTKNNKRICVEPKTGSCHEKPGECLDPAHCTWDHWNCKTCRCDHECPGNQKCCCTKDGKRMCVEPKGHHHHPHHPYPYPHPPHYPGHHFYRHHPFHNHHPSQHHHCVPCYEDKCGECPEPTHCTWNEHSRHCHRDCDCPGKQKCCVTKNNKRICVEPKTGSCHERPGECPDPAHCILGHGHYKTCRCDDDCPGRQKCCCTKDGKRMCVELKVPCYEDKCGECPEPTHCMWNEHSRHCHRDCDCPEKQKCCVTKNNKRICVEPKTGSCVGERCGKCPKPSSLECNHHSQTCKCDHDCPKPQKCCCAKDGKRVCVQPA
uniref:uncharacterized protein isoform X2 n=1 Tax=Myxine glutinosa TaxID=7769 RepID=UPI00358F4FAC